MPACVLWVWEVSYKVSIVSRSLYPQPPGSLPLGAVPSFGQAVRQ